MIKYLLGLIKNFHNIRISKLALIDNKSVVCKKAKIYRKAKIYNSNIGAFSYIGPNSEIVCCDIGKFCSISTNCMIGLATHTIKNISTSPIFTSRKNSIGYRWVKANKFNEIDRVTIGNDVWIGTRVIILGGVVIGNGVIIGAGSIVTKSIPDYAIVVGVPAKVIKYRFNSDIVDHLKIIKWWDLSEETLLNNITLFQKEQFSVADLMNMLIQSK
jgi:acetyltransferase-like isoleucine patch superfamily enzyme